MAMVAATAAMAMVVATAAMAMVVVTAAMSMFAVSHQARSLLSLPCSTSSVLISPSTASSFWLTRSVLPLVISLPAS
ncbi:hypothetical protein BX661DRAFT_189184 [Kickxella alabastrina]|uniref:uncharacterized protein n=1 Tax=Kickxella alabastrina TaxID=61397 RepID=UPI00221F95CE|nr:uncharacterized protein BX661DRAFT_189184 [Kickxella alabastrina]KAI7820367.1 hypothetical protein BX661DRAFT_189184 [Kickxella alabastrina]